MLNNECANELSEMLGVVLIRDVLYYGDTVGKVDEIVFDDDKDVKLKYGGNLYHTNPTQRLKCIRAVLNSFGYTLPNISAHRFIQAEIRDKKTRQVVAVIVQKWYEENKVRRHWERAGTK